MIDKDAMPLGNGYPNSVAVIMDGNGRWAKKRGLPRTAGHVAGARNVEKMMRTFRALGVHHLTLYAFSTENWKRPKEEVDAIMELVYKYLLGPVRRELRTDASLRMCFIGDKSALPEKLRLQCMEIEELSKGGDFICNVALNYGGRNDIVNAANRAIKGGHTELTEELISKYVYTAHSPDPDLIIRTGGDFRISNFLLWQSAYSELYVTDTLFPDFDKKEIIKALEAFGGRNRRFGGLDKK